jgi:hypothetical protein
MKQTAVEQLGIAFIQWEKDRYDFVKTGKDKPVSYDKFIKPFLEMEKQQIVDCGNTCAIKQHIHIEKVNKMTMDEMLEFANTQTLTVGEEYYNETFKNQLQG